MENLTYNGNDLPDPPKLPKGLLGEIINQAVSAGVRHLLTAVGGMLISLGWVAPDVFRGWQTAHLAEAVGLVFVLAAYAWSWLHKQEVVRQVATALKLKPYRADGSPTTVADVRRIARTNGPRVNVLSLLLIVALVLPLAACGEKDYDQATHSFALWTSRMAGYCQTGLAVTETVYDDHLISKETGAAIVTQIRNLNTANERLISEALKYVQTDPATGVEVLVLTEEGKLRLQDLVLSLQGVANGLFQNPNFLNLTNEARNRIGRVLEAIQVATQQIFSVVAQVKTLTPRTLKLSADVTISLRQSAVRRLSERRADVWASVQ